MAFTEVDVTSVLKEYPVPPQHGPLRQSEREMRCMSGKKLHRCGSSTFYKVNGVPMCMTHALRALNDMLTEDENGDGDES